MRAQAACFVCACRQALSACAGSLLFAQKPRVLLGKQTPIAAAAAAADAARHAAKKPPCSHKLLQVALRVKSLQHA